MIGHARMHREQKKDRTGFGRIGTVSGLVVYHLAAAETELTHPGE